MECVRPSTLASTQCHIIPSPKELSGLGTDWLDMRDYCFACSDCLSGIEQEFRVVFSFAASSDRLFECRQDSSCGPEEYKIAVSESGVVVSSSTERGAYYALETLKQIRRGNCIPGIQVRDYPSLPLRGFHTNLYTFCQPQAADVLHFIDLFGKFKLNAYVLEYNSRFPFRKHADLCGVDVFTRDEVEAFEALARRRHVEIIPLVQCFGHNAHIGRLPQYADLFEPVDDGSDPAQLCPCNPQGFELFKDLATEIMESHPGGRYLHIGGDETHSLGACPKCAQVVAEKGVAHLYLDYLNKVIDWVIQQGRIPIIWDDMLSHFIDAAHDLDHRVTIMYWDYWTTEQNSPIFVARPLQRGVISDRSYKESDFTGVDEPERTILQKFARAENITELLRDQRISDFAKRYLGDKVPRTFTAFPYLDFFQAEGFQVMGAPSTLGNSIDDIHGMPNYARFAKNIRSFAVKCQQQEAAGMVTSSWYNFPAEFVHLGIIDTAQNTWTDMRGYEN